jgi:hypothetical protein
MKCESGNCTRQAVYHCNIKSFDPKPVSYCRDYCPEHTKDLVDGIARVVATNNLDGGLHEYLEVEHVNAEVSQAN